MESTPRPIVDVVNLEPYEWPDIQWQYILSPAVNVIINVYRIKQRRLFKLYDIEPSYDDHDDPDPFQPYYVFYIRSSPERPPMPPPFGCVVSSFLGLDGEG